MHDALYQPRDDCAKRARRYDPRLPEVHCRGCWNMAAAEIVETTEHSVACDGGGGALGHPMIYLDMGGRDHIDCPYCGRRFVRKGAAEAEKAD
jgi:uncharacterized Zn-finger protein